jgi:hypothetical protein
VVDRFEGPALQKRTRGDQLIGLYEIQLYPRMVSYEGFWSIWGFARDLNSNSGVGINLAQIEVRNSLPVQGVESSQVSVSSSETATDLTNLNIDFSTGVPALTKTETKSEFDPMPKPASSVKSYVNSEGNIRSVGSLSTIRASVISLVNNSAERGVINSVFKKLESAPTVSTTKQIVLPKSNVVEISYKSNTPKVCAVSTSTVLRKSSGTCVLTVVTYDSDGNSFEAQKRIVLRK